jgi:hypothetical protein
MNTKNNSSQNNNNNEQTQQKKSVKDMTIEEQATYYKTMFQKSKTLNKFYDQDNKRLKEKLKNYECEDGQECELLMKFKYSKDIFYLFKDNKKLFFVNEITLSKDIIEQLKNNQSIKIYDYDKDLKSKDNYLTQIINKYEEEIKKIKKEKGEIEVKLKALQSKQDKIDNEISKEKESNENIIKNIIEKSTDINFQLKNIFEIDNFSNDDSVTKEIYSKIKENINNLKSICDNMNININSNPNNMSIWLKELNNFIIILMSELLDSTFKIFEKEKEESQEKNKYQTTIDELMINHQNEKNKLFLQIEENMKIIQKLHLKITELENEKFHISKEKENSIQQLNRQISSGANLNYLKNIMISFLSSNDRSIQDGLLPVIYKSLDFNESEIKIVQEGRNKSGGGIFSYFKSS